MNVIADIRKMMIQRGFIDASAYTNKELKSNKMDHILEKSIQENFPGKTHARIFNELWDSLPHEPVISDEEFYNERIMGFSRRTIENCVNCVFNFATTIANIRTVIIVTPGK
jgi:SAM-dependent MidA family methyltransferase